MNTAAPQPVRPPERYGEDSPAWHRTAARVAVLVLAVLGVAWVTWSGLWQGGRPSGTVVTWTVVDASHVRTSLDVTLKAGQSGRCTVEVKDNRQNTVGQTVVEVPAAAQRTRRVETVVSTQGRGAAVILDSCTAD